MSSEKPPVFTAETILADTSKRDLMMAKATDLYAAYGCESTVTSRGRLEKVFLKGFSEGSPVNSITLVTDPKTKALHIHDWESAEGDRLTVRELRTFIQKVLGMSDWRIRLHEWKNSRSRQSTK